MVAGSVPDTNIRKSDTLPLKNLNPSLQRRYSRLYHWFIKHWDLAVRSDENPPSRPLPEPLRDPGLARNVFSLVFFSDPGDFCVKNHVLHHLRSHCVTQALLRRCSEGENRCFHQTYLISLIFRDIFVIFLRSPSRIFRCPPFLTTSGAIA